MNNYIADNSLKKYSIYFLLMLSALITMFILYFNSDNTPYICKLHEELFKNGIKYGTVIKRYVDTKNHANKTVVIKERERIYTILMIPDSNDSDFYKLQVNDKITKQPNSFAFVVNQTYKFELDIDCESN